MPMLICWSRRQRHTSHWSQYDSIHEFKALVNLAQTFVSIKRREIFLTQVSSGLVLFRQLQILRELRQKATFCLFDFFTDVKIEQTPRVKLQHITSQWNCTKITPNTMWWKMKFSFVHTSLRKWNMLTRRQHDILPRTGAVRLKYH